MNNSHTKKLVSIWYYITLSVLVYLAIRYALPLIMPFIIAIVVAAIVKKPVNSIARFTKTKREAVAFFAIALITVAIISLLALIIYSIYAYLSDLLQKLPELLPQLNAVVKGVSEFFGKFTDKMPIAITELFSQLPSNMISSATKWLTDALTSTAAKLPTFIIAVGVTLFASFLVTRDYYKLTDFLNSIIPDAVMIKLIKFKSIISNKSFGMLKGYSSLMIITYVVLLIGFLIIDIPYAPAIAAIIAFIDFLPVLGTGIVLIPWSAICIFKADFVTAIGLIILYAATTVVHNILSPKMLGNQIKLDSLTVLISMYVGYGAFGIGGLIFAPFVAAIARDILMEQ